MLINRNNYEEFFLLYVDHELTAAERKAVDNFVKGKRTCSEKKKIQNLFPCPGSGCLPQHLCCCYPDYWFLNMRVYAKKELAVQQTVLWLITRFPLQKKSQLQL